MPELRRIPVLVAAAALLFTLNPAPASAFPVGTEEDARAAQAARELEEEPSAEELDAAPIDFTAIVSLSNCSGALVRFTTSRPDDKAMVLTNGHCLSGFVDPDDAVHHEPSTRTFSLLSSSGRTTLMTLRASEILYATMTGSDLALYRLTQTYAQITARTGVTALTISDRRPVAGAPIRIVSGFWRRIYSCSIDRFAFKLREAGWTFTDSIRFTQPGCETVGGTSGSPIIQADSRLIVGINNTGNSTGALCTMNNPCEVDEHGNVTAQKGASYGQELYQIYTCLDANNDINLDRTGCRLNKPR
jgi:hypothetical protein